MKVDSLKVDCNNVTLSTSVAVIGSPLILNSRRSIDEFDAVKHCVISAYSVIEPGQVMKPVGRKPNSKAAHPSMRFGFAW